MLIINRRKLQQQQPNQQTSMFINENIDPVHYIDNMNMNNHRLESDDWKQCPNELYQLPLCDIVYSKRSYHHHHSWIHDKFFLLQMSLLLILILLLSSFTNITCK